MLFFGTMLIYFIVIPIYVVIELLSIPSPKIKDTTWEDAFAIDK